MSTFNFTVDTEPMAREINSVSRHVNTTTGAVVAMQTAVVIAEGKAANHICDNVNKGFYSLIRSQISQKMAKLASEVDSSLIQLVQQKKALLNIKNRMQKDYNMIAGRYIKLFNGLNTNLKNRVFELDKPTVNFAVKEVEKYSNRSKNLTSTVPISQLESINSSQKIISSNIKNQGANLIGVMKGFLTEYNKQKKLTNKILMNESSLIKSNLIYIPIIICESVLNNDNKKTEISTTIEKFDKIVINSIKTEVNSKIDKLEWQELKLLEQNIQREINNLLNGFSKSQRVKNLIEKLSQSNVIQNLK